MPTKQLPQICNFDVSEDKEVSMQLSRDNICDGITRYATINSPWSLYYGLCVEASFNGARRQGVIFDHEDGCDHRLVFFPETCLQQTFHIENLLITHDWCGVTERWRMRGEWLFLELIEEHERNFNCALEKSAIIQLWHDVRATKAFISEIKEWTCWAGLRQLWDNLLSQAITENMIYRATNSPMVIESDCDSSDSNSKSDSESLTSDSIGTRSVDADIEESAAYYPEAVLSLHMLEPRAKNVSDLRSRARSHLLYSKWTFFKTRKKVSGKERLELRYRSPRGKVYNSLRTACKGCIEEEELSVPTTTDFKKASRKSSKPKSTRVSAGVPDQITISQMQKKRKRDQSSKRVRPTVPSNPEHHISQSILSWLVNTDILLSRAKVCYKRESDQLIMGYGRVTRTGIKCDCCQKIYGLSSFATHVGGNCQIPSANIFLEDGRSLLDCQKQIMVSRENERKLLQDGFFASPVTCQRRIKTGLAPQKSDNICSICHFGGNLLLCDQCPSAFHLNCIGLDELPVGDWSCPSCQCDICGQTDFNGNTEQFTEKTVLCCDQCEREYHVGCVQERERLKIEWFPKGNWFCSTRCEEIFSGLHGLIGTPINVGDRLTWTMLKFSGDGYQQVFDPETLIEHHSKLNVALAVAHECFEPIKGPHTKDLVGDILFNRRSTLRRLDFRGFYTVLLEKKDELISIATVRVYGGKIAEVPIVGTRVQYRKQGMCRILMNTLETKLAGFGVEMLILPAIPQVLRTWTNSFGFSEMSDSERSSLHQYVFLNFQKTTLCQKNLRIAQASSDDVVKQAPIENADMHEESHGVIPDKHLQFYARRDKQEALVQSLYS